MLLKIKNINYLYQNLFSLDEKKTGKEVEYNKEKNELTIIGTGEEITLYLLASQTGKYELELKEGDKVQAKLDLIVKM